MLMCSRPEKAEYDASFVLRMPFSIYPGFGLVPVVNGDEVGR